MSVLILRHGEADVAKHGESDSDRKLTSRGQQFISHVREKLRKIDWEPEFAMVSPAVRTQNTYHILSKDWHNCHVQYRQSLYLGDLENIVAESHEIPSSVQNLVLVGHNPGFSDAILYLSSQVYSLQPGGGVLLELTTSEGWSLALGRQGEWQVKAEI